MFPQGRKNCRLGRRKTERREAGSTQYNKNGKSKSYQEHSMCQALFKALYNVYHLIIN